VIDIIGWMATIMTIGSMMFKTMWKLRLLNGLSCIVWILYGYLIHNNPTMFVNTVILTTHIVWFISKNNRENLFISQK